jgi:hypothetical protein
VSKTPLANNEIISDYLHLKVNFKKKNYRYVNPTTQRCPNKIFKTFLNEDYFHLPTTPVVHLVLRIYPQILKTFETTLLEYSGAWEKLIHEKNLKSKSRGTVTLCVAGLEEIGFVKI